MGSEQIDWTNDEAVVRAACPNCLIPRDGLLLLELADVMAYRSWNEARACNRVQAFERAHNPALQPSGPSDEEKVRAKYPAAHVWRSTFEEGSVLHEGGQIWYVQESTRDNNRVIGRGDTELAAWADAASKLATPGADALGEAVLCKHCRREISYSDIGRRWTHVEDGRDCCHYETSWKADATIAEPVEATPPADAEAGPNAKMVAQGICGAEFEIQGERVTCSMQKGHQGGHVHIKPTVTMNVQHYEPIPTDKLKADEGTERPFPDHIQRNLDIVGSIRGPFDDKDSAVQYFANQEDYDRAKQLKRMDSGYGGYGGYDLAASFERQLREARQQLREREQERDELQAFKDSSVRAGRIEREWRVKFNEVSVRMGYAGQHYLEAAVALAERAESAEALVGKLAGVLARLVDEDLIGWRGQGYFSDGSFVKPSNEEFACEFCHCPFNTDSSLLEHEVACPVTQIRTALVEARERGMAK